MFRINADGFIGAYEPCWRGPSGVQLVVIGACHPFISFDSVYRLSADYSYFLNKHCLMCGELSRHALLCGFSIRRQLLHSYQNLELLIIRSNIQQYPHSAGTSIFYSIQILSVYVLFVKTVPSEKCSAFLCLPAGFLSFPTKCQPDFMVSNYPII